ncbi:hypothetical protein RJ55_07225 [Drechmeria coniospora]|nr:hypothetical protein RJ55_07225 [Drechmeria coniospora]
MASLTVWKRLPGKLLLATINLVAATALIFEGYNQGVYGTISGTPGFIAMAGIGSDGIVTDVTKQGGLAAAYYFGAMWACFIGGWVGDTIGRRRGTALGAAFGIVGAALQASSRGACMFLFARVVAGIGVGFVNSIVPPWVSELSESHDRGACFSLVFVANYLGVVLSYWINFGLRDADPSFRWQCPLACMILPLLVVLVALPFLPESPRWLLANDRRNDAIDILCKLRGDLASDDVSIRRELEQMDALVEATRHKRNRLVHVILGGRHSGPLHLGRRAVMGFALQWIQQWSGILAVVGWAGTLFALAGFGTHKSLLLAGLANAVGVPGTAAAALVVDRIGRVRSLLASFVLQAACLFSIAILIKASQDAAAAADSDRASRLGTAAASFVFVYTWFFTMFNIIPAWCYGTEIWPPEIRAKGYSFTIFGWATGCGMTQFLIPIMLSRLGYGTYIFFGAINMVVLPIIWLFYPEVANRSLEEVSLLFTSDNPLVSSNMREYHRRVDEAGGNVAVAARRLLDEASQPSVSSTPVVRHGAKKGAKGSPPIQVQEKGVVQNTATDR